MDPKRPAESVNRLTNTRTHSYFLWLTGVRTPLLIFDLCV